MESSRQFYEVNQLTNNDLSPMRDGTADPEQQHRSDITDKTAPDCSGGTLSRYHALVCWLWDAQITLPNEQFEEEIFTIVSWVFVHIDAGVQCVHFGCSC